MPSPRVIMCCSPHRFAVRAATHYHTRAWQTLIYGKDCLSSYYRSNSIVATSSSVFSIPIDRSRCKISSMSSKITFANTGMFIYRSASLSFDQFRAVGIWGARGGGGPCPPNNLHKYAPPPQKKKKKKKKSTYESPP